MEQAPAPHLAAVLPLHTAWPPPPPPPPPARRPATSPAPPHLPSATLQAVASAYAAAGLPSPPLPSPPSPPSPRSPPSNTAPKQVAAVVAVRPAPPRQVLQVWPTPDGARHPLSLATAPADEALCYVRWRDAAGDDDDAPPSDDVEASWVWESQVAAAPGGPAALARFASNPPRPATVAAAATPSSGTLPAVAAEGISDMAAAVLVVRSGEAAAAALAGAAAGNGTTVVDIRPALSQLADLPAPAAAVRDTLCAAGGDPIVLVSVSLPLATPTGPTTDILSDDGTWVHDGRSLPTAVVADSACAAPPSLPPGAPSGALLLPPAAATRCRVLAPVRRTVCVCGASLPASGVCGNAAHTAAVASATAAAGPVWTDAVASSASTIHVRASLSTSQVATLAAAGGRRADGPTVVVTPTAADAWRLVDEVHAAWPAAVAVAVTRSVAWIGEWEASHASHRAPRATVIAIPAHLAARCATELPHHLHPARLLVLCRGAVTADGVAAAWRAAGWHGTVISLPQPTPLQDAAAYQLSQPSKPRLTVLLTPEEGDAAAATASRRSGPLLCLATSADGGTAAMEATLDALIAPQSWRGGSTTGSLPPHMPTAAAWRADIAAAQQQPATPALAAALAAHYVEAVTHVAPTVVTLQSVDLAVADGARAVGTFHLPYTGRLRLRRCGSATVMDPSASSLAQDIAAAGLLPAAGLELAVPPYTIVAPFEVGSPLYDELARMRAAACEVEGGEVAFGSPAVAPALVHAPVPLVVSADEAAAAPTGNDVDDTCVAAIRAAAGQAQSASSTPTVTVLCGTAEVAAKLPGWLAHAGWSRSGQDTWVSPAAPEDDVLALPSCTLLRTTTLAVLAVATRPDCVVFLGAPTWAAYLAAAAELAHLPADVHVYVVARRGGVDAELWRDGGEEADALQVIDAHRVAANAAGVEAGLVRDCDGLLLPSLARTVLEEAAPGLSGQVACHVAASLEQLAPAAAASPAPAAARRRSRAPAAGGAGSPAAAPAATAAVVATGGAPYPPSWTLTAESAHERHVALRQLASAVTESTAGAVTALTAVASAVAAAPPGLVLSTTCGAPVASATAEVRDALHAVRDALHAGAISAEERERWVGRLEDGVRRMAEAIAAISGSHVAAAGSATTPSSVAPAARDAVAILAGSECAAGVTVDRSLALPLASAIMDANRGGRHPAAAVLAGVVVRLAATVAAQHPATDLLAAIARATDASSTWLLPASRATLTTCTTALRRARAAAEVAAACAVVTAAEREVEAIREGLAAAAAAGASGAGAVGDAAAHSSAPAPAPAPAAWAGTGLASLCGTCHTGGVLLACDGVCGAVHHATCMGRLSVAPPRGAAPYLAFCNHCAAASWPCAVCGQVGTLATAAMAAAEDVAGADAAVFRCAVAGCPTMLHARCGDRAGLQPAPLPASGVLLHGVRCPRHACATCRLPGMSVANPAGGTAVAWVVSTIRDALGLQQRILEGGGGGSGAGEEGGGVNLSACAFKGARVRGPATLRVEAGVEAAAAAAPRGLVPCARCCVAVHAGACADGVAACGAAGHHDGDGVMVCSGDHHAAVAADVAATAAAAARRAGGSGDVTWEAASALMHGRDMAAASAVWEVPVPALLAMVARAAAAAVGADGSVVGASVNAASQAAVLVTLLLAHLADRATGGSVPVPSVVGGAVAAAIQVASGSGAMGVVTTYGIVPPPAPPAAPAVGQPRGVRVDDAGYDGAGGVGPLDADAPWASTTIVRQAQRVAATLAALPAGSTVSKLASPSAPAVRRGRPAAASRVAAANGGAGASTWASSPPPPPPPPSQARASKASSTLPPLLPPPPPASSLPPDVVDGDADDGGEGNPPLAVQDGGEGEGGVAADGAPLVWVMPQPDAVEASYGTWPPLPPATAAALRALVEEVSVAEAADAALTEAEVGAAALDGAPPWVRSKLAVVRLAGEAVLAARGGSGGGESGGRMVDVAALRCVLCRRAGEGDLSGADGGPFLPVALTQRGATPAFLHLLCAVASPEFIMDDAGRLYFAARAIKRSRFLRCKACNAPGATVGCLVAACSASFHAPCGLAGGLLSLTHRDLFCPRHHTPAIMAQVRHGRSGGGGSGGSVGGTGNGEVPAPEPAPAADNTGSDGTPVVAPPAAAPAAGTRRGRPAWSGTTPTADDVAAAAAGLLMAGAAAADGPEPAKRPRVGGGDDEGAAAAAPDAGGPRIRLRLRVGASGAPTEA